MATEQYAKAVKNFDTLLADHPDSPHTQMAQLNRIQALYALEDDGKVIASADAFASSTPRAIACVMSTTSRRCRSSGRANTRRQSHRSRISSSCRPKATNASTRCC